MSDINPDISEGANNLEEHKKVCQFNLQYVQKYNQLSDQDFYNVYGYLSAPE